MAKRFLCLADVTTCISNSLLGRQIMSLFIMAVMLVIGGDVAWGQTSYGKAEIIDAPNSFIESQTITNDGNVMACYQGTTEESEFSSNYGANQLDSKWFVKLSDKGFIKIRVAKGTVAAGDLLRVEVRDIYNNGNNQTLGFQVEGSNGTVGIKETDNALHTLDYTLTTADIRVDPDNNSYDYIQINRNGNSGCGYHSVEILRNTHYTVSLTQTEVSSVGTPYFTINNGERHYGVGETGEIGATGTVKFYSGIADEYKDTHLPAWYEAPDKRNWDEIPTYVNPAKNISLDVKYVEGARMTATFTTGSAQPANALTFMQGGWDRGDNILVYGNTDLTLTAKEITGYKFLGWYSDEAGNIRITESLTHAVKDGAGTHTYYAKYKMLSHTVTFGVVDKDNHADVEKGTLTATVDGVEIHSGDKVQEGKQIVFTAVPADGMIAWGWYKDGARNYSGNPYTVTVGNADLTINAVIHAGITLTAIQSSSSTNYGTTRIECSGDRGTSFHTNPGTPNVQFIATPKEGATFAGWYSDDACNSLVSNDNPYTIASPNETKTLYAKFTVPENTYGIEWSANIPEGCDAWFTVNGGDTKYKESVYGLAADASIRYQATDIDNPSKLISNWTVGGNGWYNYASDRTFKINDSNVTKSDNIVTLRPNFDDAYTYKATASAGCTVSIVAAKNDDSDQLSINGKKFSKNDGREKITLSTSSSDGLTFDGWYEDGVKIDEAAATYVITITSETKKDRTFEARYTVPQPIGGQRVKAQLANLAKGNVPTWENGHMATDATSYNHVDIFRFPKVSDGNVNVSNSADNYTGIRFHAKGPKDGVNDKNSTPFRVLVYVNGETNARITNIPAGNKEYVYTWSELGIPATNVANIERICFAGQQNGPTDVIFDNVWVEKIDDPCHTFVTYGDDIASYKWVSDDEKGTMTYTLPTPEGNATAAFTKIVGGDRKGYTNEMKLKENLTITAPTGKTINAIKIITDAQASDFTFPAGDGLSTYTKTVTDGNEIVWVRNGVNSVTISKAGSTVPNIAKIEIIYSENGLHPALKIEEGVANVNLNLVKGTSNYAYDVETHTLHASATAAYKGNLCIEFEEPQNLTTLSRIAIDYTGDQIVDYVEFYGADGQIIKFTENEETKNAAMYGINLASTDVTNTDLKAALTAVKKIVFPANTDHYAGAMKLNSIKLSLTHIDPKVALDKGINTYYKISVGQKVYLSAHATAGEGGPNAVFWSAWNGANNSDGAVSDGLRVWDSSYTFTATEVGDYYFGARASQNCSAHEGSEYNWSSAEGAIVHIEVVKNNIYENLNLDFTDNTYTEDGWAKGRQYRIYVPQSICNGTDADKANVPVVFSLHGTGNNNNPDQGGLQNFNELAEQHKFIVVYPQGRKTFKFDVFGDELKRGWEATGKENEDTKFFRAIIADLKTDRSEFMLNGVKQFTSIDESRIYMTGFSNGGMMAYAEANTSADIFAAFGSISGIPVNEMHMRHHNARPVPFIHIHGTKDGFVKYSHMPTIVDNMLFRNGLALTPNEIGEGAANGGTTRYKMSSYTDGAAPYIYYEIGTGSNTSDTGMGHDSQCTIGDKSSMQVMWEFFADKTLPETISNPFEFKARINTANNVAREHGWQTNTSSGILAQYGESGGYTTTGENVYHTIHLGNGTHSIQFKANSTETTHYVMVKVTKLADFTAFNTMGKHQVSVSENVILNNVPYYVHPETAEGVISIPFNGGEGEYMITITKGGKWDNTTLQDVAIVSGEVSKGDPYDKHVDTNFAGYFNYNNRLFAQWNFDLSDGYRTNARKLQANADEQKDNRAWTANLSNTDFNGTTLNNGTVVFTNRKPFGTSLDDSSKDTDLSTYDELTYNGSYVQGATDNDLIAVAAGLKFKAPAESVKIYVDIANGQITGSHLVVNEKVKMYIPYVENSYRNDKNEASQPQDHKDDFKNCLHHINRDILYIALNQGSIWDEWNNGHFVSQGHIKNEPIDLPGQTLFRDGGDEFVNNKNYNKADYLGKNGTPCILQFNRETVIDRIGVNRNLIYSFYSEYIAELGKTKPNTRFRVVGSPSGQRIANDGASSVEYTGAIAMTYGGWLNSKGGSTYRKYDDAETTDAWSELGIVNYAPTGNEIKFNTWANLEPSTADTKTLPAIDGFPVVSVLDTEARSGSLLPSSLAPQVTKTEDNVDYVTEKDKDGNVILVPNYYPQCEGLYIVPTQENPYKANVTPWSLPSRGGYAKFEPSLPGVLNMNVLQKGGAAYYIADEFGKLVDQATIFSKTGTGQAISKDNNSYTVSTTDYVKHSLNVEPGKTYYIFSNTAGLGIAGFYFEPYVNHDGTERGRINIGVREMKLSPGTAYSLPDNVSGSETILSPTADGNKAYTIQYSNKAVKVNLRRAFNANQWESICLPYSMNQVQMEQVFGEGTRVVLLRDVQSPEHSVDGKRTMTLVCHENQDIIAGYPYLIRPTKAAPNGVVTIASMPQAGNLPSLVMVNSTGTNTNSYADKTYGGEPDWTFKGHYGGSETVSDGSYIVHQGVLKQVKNQNGKSTTISGYRAWMEKDVHSLNAKPIELFIGADGEIDDSATAAEEISIDDILEQNGIFANESTVYGVNGQVVRRNATNLNNLPKGIYIVNGKKYIVK